MEIQKQFFELIKGKLPESIRLADITGDVLGIKSDAAYRRIRGESELSLNEYVKLSKHFGVSVEAMLKRQSDNVSFKYNSLNSTDFEKFYIYKNSLAMTFEGIAAAKEKEMLVTALDVSVYHLTPFKELSFFKDYTWFQSAGKEPMTYEQFVKSIDTERVAGYFDRITDAYQQIPSTEIWTHDTLNPMLNLLEYFVALDCFENKRETLPVLFRQLIELIERVEQNTERGWKEYKGEKIPCCLYLSPLSIMNDLFVANCNGAKVGTIKLHTINALFTDNEYFCSEIEKWLVDMQSKSLPLTGGSARERMQFFKRLRDKVEEVMARLRV